MRAAVQSSLIPDPLKAVAAATRPGPRQDQPEGAAAATSRSVAARLAGNEATYDGAAELDAWSRHTMAANGFASVELALAARHARTHALGEAIGTGLIALARIAMRVTQAIAERARARGAARRRRREVIRAATELRDLDPHLLRDIGVTDPELIATLARLHGGAEAARVDALRDLHQLGLGS